MEILHWSARLRRIWDNLFTSRYERHLYAQIDQLTLERDSFKAKSERLENAMLAGQRYIRSDVPPPAPVKPRSDTWAGMQAEFAEELNQPEKEKN